MKTHWGCLKIACIFTGLLVTGCDTVAELTFQDEQLIELNPVGLLPAGCSQADADSDAVLRFSVLTSFNEMMMPGKRYSAFGDLLVAGQNFKASHITLSDGWFFVVDTAGRDVACNESSDCVSGASCVTPAEMGLDQYYYPPGRYCAFHTTIKAVSNPIFYHYRDDAWGDSVHVKSSHADGRSFAFVLDNSATLDGSISDGVPNAAAATDPYQYRKVGLSQFMDSLQTGEHEAQKLEFSAIFANGTGTNGVFDISTAWMRTIGIWNATVMQKYPSPSGSSPIWEAAAATLEKIMNSANTGYLHTMIAITDGAPNGGTDTLAQNFGRQLGSSDVAAVYWLDFEQEDVAPHRPYADIAGQSCGGYYLFSNATQFPTIMRNIALNSASHWDVSLDFSASLPAGFIYRLATNIVIRVGNTAVSYEAQRKSEQQMASDYRLVFAR